MPAKPRKHGLERPFTRPQIITWFVVPALGTAYFLTVLNFYEDQEQLIFVYIYAVAIALLIVMWLLCTFLDPAKDAFLFCPTMGQEQRDLELYCAHSRKKVKGFDHFCAWLNTAIGNRNYPFFIALTMLGLVLNATHLVAVSILLFSDREEVDDRAEDILGSVALLNVLLGVQLFFAAGATFAFFNLALFHAQLQFKGYGTYQYLVNRRQRRRTRAYERASRADFDQVTLKERVSTCGGLCPEKEDKATRMTIEVTRVDEPRVVAAPKPEVSEAESAAETETPAENEDKKSDIAEANETGGIV